jgi:hypothetical protein
LAEHIPWRSVFSVNSPVSVSIMARLCCLACKSQNLQFSSRPPSFRAFWLDTAKSTRSAARPTVVMTSVEHRQSHPSIGQSA